MIYSLWPILINSSDLERELDGLQSLLTQWFFLLILLSWLQSTGQCCQSEGCCFKAGAPMPGPQFEVAPHFAGHMELELPAREGGHTEGFLPGLESNGCSTFPPLLLLFVLRLCFPHLSSFFSVHRFTLQQETWRGGRWGGRKGARCGIANWGWGPCSAHASSPFLLPSSSHALRLPQLPSSGFSEGKDVPVRAGRGKRHLRSTRALWGQQPRALRWQPLVAAARRGGRGMLQESRGRLMEAAAKSPGSSMLPGSCPREPTA